MGRLVWLKEKFLLYVSQLCNGLYNTTAYTRQLIVSHIKLKSNKIPVVVCSHRECDDAV